MAAQSLSREAAASLERVLDYHERSKHQIGRYARSLGYLDWSSQPDPFRSYTGASLIPLAEVLPATTPHYDALFEPGSVSIHPPDSASISQLFYDSLALSAWKSYQGERWALRCNPSSGNLHPTEGYLIAGPLPGLSDTAGLYHYQPYLHGLEHRAKLAPATWEALRSGLPADALLVGLSSIHWRESWKYGERAYRYCQHDAGHAIAAITLAAAALGWEARLLAGVGDAALARLLGIAGQDGYEAEHPDCLLALFPHGSETVAGFDTAYRLPALPVFELHGRPNRLSHDHHPWPVIEEVAAAAWRGDPAFADGCGPRLTLARPPAPPGRDLSARQIIRQRRSAVAMDGRTQIERETFYGMLARTLPGPHPPFPALPWQPALHLALFVHRVRGLAPGLYLLARDPGQAPALRAALAADFRWQRPPGCPQMLPLYLLAEGDLRQIARTLCCQQNIAADGAFALSMLAEFEPRLRRCGPWFYRHLHWEAGAIGQVLYLEAEAAGVRATGIGCFFDDPTHRTLGLNDRRFQTIYHFTVGGPLEDTRLETLPAYHHRDI